MAQPVSDVVHDIEQYSPRSGRIIGEDEQIYNLVDLLGSGSGGTNNHASLSNLDIANSGHTGFASEVALNNEISNRETAIAAKQGQIETLNGELQATNADLSKTNESLWGHIDEETREWVDGDIQRLEDIINYNAILQIDVTSTPAPPSLHRARYWHVDMVGDLQGSYDYDRYFYLTADEAQVDDDSTAVARWRIDGQRVFFEYFDGGVLTRTVDITAIDGSVILETFRPITEAGVVWFFGASRGTSAFPDADNIRSVIDINIPALQTIIGDSFTLATESKQLVGAINEIFTLHHIGSNVYTSDSSPDGLSGISGDVAITPYGVYVMRLGAASTGFKATTTDQRFVGVWSDMGVNTQGTTTGESLGTHWYLHESGNYVLVWSSYNANPSIPRAGYWFINHAGTPRLDGSASLAYMMTPTQPLDSTTLPESGQWGWMNISWEAHEGTIPSQLGWERLFGIYKTPDSRAFVDEFELLRAVDLATANIPGTARVVYENSNVQLNPSWGGVIDTGISPVDGATYEIIVSTIEGTAGATSSTANMVLPILLNDDGTIFGFPTASGYSMTAVSNVYITFRFQERIVATDPTQKSIFLNRLSNTFGSVLYTTTPNADIDDPAATFTEDFPTGATPFRRRQNVAADNVLRLGFEKGTGITTANLRLLVKIIERQSTTTPE